MNRFFKVVVYNAYTYSDWCTHQPSLKRGYTTKPHENREAFRLDVSNRFEILERLGNEFYPSETNVRISTKCATSYFMKSTMEKIGGGESRLFHQLGDLDRRGGGHDDGMKILRLHDYIHPEAKFLRRAGDYARELGLAVGCLTPLTVDELDGYVSQNITANPGPTYKMMGFDKKGNALPVAWSVFKELFDAAAQRPIGDFCVPRYALAGRTKLSTLRKVEEAARAGKPFGRAVWMADQHEQLVCALFTEPLYQWFRENNSPVQNGFNKFGGDPGQMTDIFQEMNTFISVDYSGFDYHITPSLVEMAFDVIRVGFGANLTERYSRLLNWIEDEIINTRVVLPNGRVVMCHGGLPSGSGFTALLGSVMNYIMISDAMRAQGIINRRIFVQGDDSITGLYIPANHQERRENGRRIVDQLSKYVFDSFNSVVNIEKTHIATNLFVSYVQPRVPRAILDSSSIHIRRYRTSERQRLGRPLTFDEMFVELDFEPGEGGAPGNTHRWSYLFKGRAKFLSHYFKRDRNGTVTCVRPTREVVERLLIPERRVKNLSDHIDRLEVALVENYNNRHVVNHVMHYMFDAFCLQNAGITTPRHFRDVESENFDWRRLPRSSQQWMRRRARYRRVDGYVDPREFHEDFWPWWQKKMETASVVNRALNDPGGEKWVFLRLLRRGIFKSPGALGGLSSFVNDGGATLGLSRLAKKIRGYRVGVHLLSKYEDVQLLSRIITKGWTEEGPSVEKHRIDVVRYYVDKIYERVEHMDLVGGEVQDRYAVGDHT